MDAVIQFEGTIYEDGYGLLAQKVMRDKNLHRNSRLIYAYMCSFASVGANGDRVAFPSISLQCGELGMSEDTYLKYRKPLLEKGYIHIKKADRKKGQFQRNLYVIKAVPIPVVEAAPEEENQQETEGISPTPKNSGMDNSPTPNSSGMDDSCTEEPCTEEMGTNSTSSISTSSINNNSNIDLNLNHMNEYIWQLRLPMPLKKFFSDKVKVLVTTDTTFDISEIEYFYNTYRDYIDPLAPREDVYHLNDIEFTKCMKKMYSQVQRPIGSMEGLIKKWVLLALSYKRDNNEEYEAMGH